MIGIAAALLLSVAGAGFWYYSWSQDKIDTLTKNNAVLNQAVDTQSETIAAQAQDAKKVSKQIIFVNKKFREARTENNNLRDKLAKHDIGFLAQEKPGLMKRIVNNGTRDVGRCFEILSGSPLTEQEKSATKKSQINSSCPNLANPSYEVKK
jgi:hypothetical protein